MFGTVETTRPLVARPGGPGLSKPRKVLKPLPHASPHAVADVFETSCGSLKLLLDNGLLFPNLEAVKE